ncbi:PKD domain-containing protein [Arthrobacter frigidicola]|nr:PKD domain-containing protein [Arthrobacter frigidicola]
MGKQRPLLKVLGSAVASLMVLTGLAVLSAPASGAVARTGADAATAAASCWEIKQNNAAVPSGTYWLLTPKMAAPAQFYCDMVTGGGGWVLVGKGREKWMPGYEGTGNPTALQTAGVSPMSGATTQYSSTVVDALLNGSRVDSLADGIRLKRAKNTTGTAWHETRIALAKRDRWVWTFSALHPITWYSFDGVRAPSGGVTASFGVDDAYRKVKSDARFDSGQNYTMGFAYGSGVKGTTSAGTYLWSATEGLGGARPYTEVFIRPRIFSTTGFTAIPDAGTAAKTNLPVAESVALDSPWGVTGFTTRRREGDVEVQAFAQSGNRMFVGGNFTAVQRTSTGTDKVARSFLAAFDVTTGELLTDFVPKLNAPVMSLAVLPNGNLVAGGYFTTANGAAATSIVALNPTTGATVPGWTVKVEDRTTSGILRVGDLAVKGNWLYLGGAFTHVAGGSNPTTFKYTRNAARVSVTDGTPATNWNPDFNGTVVSIDPSDDGSRLYAAGYFTAKGSTAASKAAAVQTVDGAPLATPAWNPTWSSNSNYQQTIGQVGNRVWVGGSEHSFFSFSTSTFARLSGNIGQKNGDFQAIAESPRGILYGGSHGHHFNYSNAFFWPNMGTGWTQADAYEWTGAWNAATGDYIPSFTPAMKFRSGSGIWAQIVDSNGTLWAGGDMTTARTRSSGSSWAGGFARFPQRDAVAPTRPGTPTISDNTASTVRLTWAGSSDAGSRVTYQILRDDRVVATTTGTTAVVPKDGSNRFFVRAADTAGNLSASTPVVTASAALTSANSAPAAAFTSKATGLAATFDGSGSTDSDGTIASYAWDFGDGSTGTGATATRTYAAAGTYTVKLTVTDDKGATGVKSAPVTVSAAAANSAPAAAFTSKATGLAASFDGSGSTDSDGTIASYAWDFGDGSTGTGATATRTYAAAGTYTVKLTVTDDKGATGVKSAPVTVSAAVAGQESVLIAAKSPWSWRYEAPAPPTSWKANGFDATAWKSGPAVLGFGSAGLGTDVDFTPETTTDRPLTAYFLRQFSVPSAASVSKLTLQTVADDGVVVYVNGTEVGRKNLPTGPISHSTYASSSVSTSTANTTPFVIDVPVALLVDGVNTVAVETHVNYRATRDMSMDLTAKATTTN